MRIFWVTALLVVALEALLAGVFLIGYFTIGGWLAGVLLALGVLLLLLLPWLGDLVVDYSLADERVAVKLAWWGRAVFAGRHEPELRLRFLGLPYRRKMPRKPEPKAPSKRKLVYWAHLAGWAKAHLEQLGRLLLSSVDAGHLLFWQARELRVEAANISGKPAVERVIERLFHRFTAGPLQLQYLAGERRRLEFHYRIRMWKVGQAGLYLLLQGQPKKLAALWSKENAAARKAERETERTKRRLHLVSEQPPASEAEDLRRAVG